MHMSPCVCRGPSRFVRSHGAMRGARTMMRVLMLRTVTMVMMRCDRRRSGRLRLHLTLREAGGGNQEH